MAKGKSKIIPILGIGVLLYWLYSRATNIPKNIGVGITKVSNVRFSLPDIFIKYDFEVVNFNNFALPIQGILGEVWYGNVLVGQISSQQETEIPANGKRFLSIDIQASLLSLGADVYSKITNKESFKGNLIIKGQIYSGGLGFPFERQLF